MNITFWTEITVLRRPRNSGRSEIMAKIVEFIPSSNTLENIIYREKKEFVEQTGLTHPLDISEVGQFPYLLEQVENHRAFLAGRENPGATLKAGRRRLVHIPSISP
jgi:hypothetical protein